MALSSDSSDDDEGAVLGFGDGGGAGGAGGGDLVADAMKGLPRKLRRRASLKREQLEHAREMLRLRNEGERLNQQLEVEQIQYERAQLKGAIVPVLSSPLTDARKPSRHGCAVVAMRTTADAM